MSKEEVELHQATLEDAETTLDDLLPMLRGKIGCFQIWLCVFGLCVTVPACMISSLPLFILTIPEHRCALDGWENDTYSVQNSYHRQLINTSIPVDENGMMSSCTIFRHDDVNGSSLDTRSEVSCQRWVYDKSVFDLSLIEELDLVCDRTHIRTVANTMLFLGDMVSLPMQGMISDYFGRRMSILSCALAMIFGAWSTLLIYDVPSLYILRFLAGFGASQMYMASFILIIEFQESKYRRRYNCLLYILWCVGIFMMIPLAYFVSDYWKLSIAIGCITTLLTFSAWFVPESPRWLLSKGRISEARTVLRRMAKVNRVTFPDGVFDQVASYFNRLGHEEERLSKGKELKNSNNDQAFLKNGNKSNEYALETKTTKSETGSFVQFFKHKSLCIRFFILILNWCTFILVYVALMYNLANLGGSLHLNFGLFNFVELIGIALAYLTMDRMGRSLSYLILLMLSTAACLATIFPVLLASDGVSENVINILGLVGRLGNAGSLIIFFLYSSELMPTSIRNRAMSAFATIGSITSLLGPFVADIGLLLGGKFQSALPLMVCGTMGLLAFVSALALPETKGTPLPDTIEEARRLKDRKRQECFSPCWGSRHGS